MTVAFIVEGMSMKLKESFVTHNTETEHVMISVDAETFAGLVRSNDTAAFIVEQLKNETTPEQLVSACLERYEVSEDDARKGVEYVLNELRKIGALSE